MPAFAGMTGGDGFCGSNLSRMVTAPLAQVSKSFLLLFFKKEALALL
jgi:hypothetical protein